jgi:hypothetical protein
MLAEEYEQKADKYRMLSMVASYPEQIKAINKNIENFEREASVLRGEYESYGDPVVVKEVQSPKPNEVFRLLRGGLA